MKKVIGLIVLAFSIAGMVCIVGNKPVVSMEMSSSFESCSDEFVRQVVDRMNSEYVNITIGGMDAKSYGYDMYISDEVKLMVDTDFLKSFLACSVQVCEDGRICILKGDNKCELELGSSLARINDRDYIDMLSEVTRSADGEKIFVPFDDIAYYLYYDLEYFLADNLIAMAKLPDEKLLPAAYDMRDYDRVTAVRDQGRYGTCWAFASLGALETTLMPEEYNVFSTDHMTLCNSYNLDLNKGGEHTMSIAYLAAWQGPVYEKDDPYGDGVTNTELKAVKHLEEALVIDKKDMDILKSAIFRYGGVETSIYSAMDYVDSKSKYYNADTASYFYNGEQQSNHDIVVVGWDDNYPKEKFTITPESDGAFICKNSWGEEFGEDGFFYVSYEDVNICNKSVVYTRVGEADNYDKIYQSDLLGWVGLMGFGSEESYFANVYKAGKGEELAAVSFYATDVDSEFEVYVVTDFEGVDSFANRKPITSGSMKYAGYYTVDFPENIRLEDNSRYAVIVKIKTPGAVHPIAIEYNVDERTENFDISDGEGYISLYGEVWHSAEGTEECNVCLKAFTNYVDE